LPSDWHIVAWLSQVVGQHDRGHRLVFDMNSPVAAILKEQAAWGEADDRNPSQHHRKSRRGQRKQPFVLRDDQVKQVESPVNALYDPAQDWGCLPA